MDGPLEEQLRRLLRQISENSKKLKSQMSKHLRELRDVAHAQLAALSDREAELVLAGDGELPGLMGFCGTPTKFSDRLKNSALTALNVLLELIQIAAPPTFANAFFTLDAAAYRQMRLHQHVVQGGENAKVAQEIARAIRERRPFLPVTEYIASKALARQFELQHASAAAPRGPAAEEAQAAAVRRNLDELLHAAGAAEQPPEARNYEIYFYDVLAADDDIVGPVMGRPALFKEVTQVCLPGELRPVALYLHPESRQFNAAAFLEAFHHRMSADDRADALARIRRYCSGNANAFSALLRRSAGMLVALFLSNCAIEHTFIVRSASFKAMAGLEEAEQRFGSLFGAATAAVVAAKRGFGVMRQIYQQSRVLGEHLDNARVLRSLVKVRNLGLLPGLMEKALQTTDTAGVFSSLQAAMKRDLGVFLDEFNAGLFEAYGPQLSADAVVELLAAQTAATKIMKRDAGAVSLRVAEKLLEASEELLGRGEATERARGGRGRIKTAGYLAFYLQNVRRATAEKPAAASRVSVYSAFAGVMRTLQRVMKLDHLVNWGVSRIAEPLARLDRALAQAVLRDFEQAKDAEQLKHFVPAVSEARAAFRDFCDDFDVSCARDPAPLLEIAARVFGGCEEVGLPTPAGVAMSVFDFFFPRISDFFFCLKALGGGAGAQAQFLNRLFASYTQRLVAAAAGPERQAALLSALFTTKFLLEELLPILPALVSSTHRMPQLDSFLLAPAAEAVQEAQRRFETDLLVALSRELAPVLAALNYSCLIDLALPPAALAAYVAKVQGREALVAKLVAELRYALEGETFFLEPRTAAFALLATTAEFCAGIAAYPARFARRALRTVVELILSEARAHAACVEHIADPRVRFQNAFETEVLLHLLDPAAEYKKDPNYDHFRQTFADLEKRELDRNPYPKYLAGKLSYAKRKFARVFAFGALTPRA